ncbi:MAG: ATP-binding protein [Balneolaceae bacterium]|nr:MAG: ATP-binding protein [Balneolaceae bacterium]
MAHKTFQLSLKSTYEESERVPDFVVDIQEKIDLEEETTANLMLLLSEAATNAIVHGNKLDESKSVTIEVVIEKDKVISSVQDEGEGFEPQNTKDPLNEENLMKTSGRGVFLINEISDSVAYSDNGRRIEFTLLRAG